MVFEGFEVPLFSSVVNEILGWKHRPLSALEAIKLACATVPTNQALKRRNVMVETEPTDILLANTIWHHSEVSNLIIKIETKTSPKPSYERKGIYTVTLQW